RFNPSLPVLALRAERAFPQLAGMLASGIEFATHRQALSPPTAGPATQVLADHSINAAMTLAAQQPGRSLRTLLKGGLTTRYACTAAGALLLLSMLVLVLPEASLLAARRWVDPLDGAHQWPKR